MAKIMKEPELAAAMQKPKVMQAIMVSKKRTVFKSFSSLSFFSRPATTTKNTFLTKNFEKKKLAHIKKMSRRCSPIPWPL